MSGGMATPVNLNALYAGGGRGPPRATDDRAGVAPEHDPTDAVTRDDETARARAEAELFRRDEHDDEADRREPEIAEDRLCAEEPDPAVGERAQARVPAPRDGAGAERRLGQRERDARDGDEQGC